MIGSGLPDAEILVLPLLSLAAGVELYLTLFVLSGASAVGWLADPPWALSSAGSPLVLGAVAVRYGLELACETRAMPALLWHAAQTVARPVAGGLLGLSLVSSGGGAAAALGALAGGGLAWAAHETKRGADVRRWLGEPGAVAPYLVSAFEDAVVLGLVFVGLERPAVAGGVGLVAVAAVVAARRPLRPAARLGFRLVWDRVWSVLSARGWKRSSEIPASVREEWRRGGGDEDGLRGIRAGVRALPGRSGLAYGWLLSSGRSVRFAVPAGRGVELVSFEDAGRTRVEEGPLYDRVVVAGGSGEPESAPVTLILPKTAPPARAVAADLRDLVAGGR